MGQKTAFILVYFGDSKPWHPFFLESCSWNPDFNWFIFGDCASFGEVPDNVHCHSITLKEFNRLASQKTGIEIEVKEPFKLCDMKPAYGEIFSEHITDYDYWGYIDEDVVYGDLNDLFREKGGLAKYDVLTSGDSLKGHMTIMRNRGAICTLYRELDYWEEIFQSDIYYGMDENLWGIWSKKLVFGKTSEDYNPLGLDGLLRSKKGNRELKVHFFDKICEGYEIGNNIMISFRHSRIRSLQSNLYFHLLNLKRDDDFKEFPGLLTGSSQFIAVSKFGITSSWKTLLIWLLRLTPRKCYKWFRDALSIGVRSLVVFPMDWSFLQQY